MFEVGQKVWDVVAGEGTVTRIENGNRYPVVASRINKDYHYPVIVKLSDGNERTYTTDGKSAKSNERPSLYTFPVEIVKKITKPSINWEHVHNKFKWIAQDAEGGCWLYEDKPVEGDGEWKCSSGDCTSAEGFISLIPGTCDWKDSLVERPAM